MDACINGYYSLGPEMSIKKRSNLVKVMKSAINVSKSKTGEAVFRDNKLEKRNNSMNLLAVERMQTYNQITLDHSTRLFERKKKDLIKFHNDHSIPEPIRQMQNRYDELKEQIKMRQVSMWNKASDGVSELPELSSALTERLKREPHGHSFVKRESEEHPMVTQSLPSLRGSATRRRTQLVTRESVRKPANHNKQPPTPNRRPDWCDKNRIYEFLYNQNQHQEAMYFKLRLDRWNTMMDEKEKVMNEKYPGGENHLYSVELSKRSNTSDRKSDVSRFYSRNSNHTLFQAKSMDHAYAGPKKKVQPRKTVAEKLALKRNKNKGFDCNKSVTFVE